MPDRLLTAYAAEAGTASAIAETGGSALGVTTTGTMPGNAFEASRSLPFQRVKYFGSSPRARQYPAWVWPDLRYAAKCSAHQARTSSRRLERERRLVGIGILLRQYMARSVAGADSIRQTRIYGCIQPVRHRLRRSIHQKLRIAVDSSCRSAHVHQDRSLREGSLKPP